MIVSYKLSLCSNYHKLNAVVFSDYAKGALQNLPALIQAAKAQQLPILIDPKSQDFNCYRGASILTPNRKEFEAVVGQCGHTSRYY